MRIVTLATTSLLAAACGTTAPERAAPRLPPAPEPAVPDARPAPEHGLAALRASLELLPATGRVVRDDRGRWLVDDATGARLLAVPEAECEVPSSDDPEVPSSDYPEEVKAWRLFRGDLDVPGAALALRKSGFTVYTFDTGRGCRVAASVLEPALPEDDAEPLLQALWEENRTGAPREPRETTDVERVVGAKPWTAVVRGPSGEPLTATLTPTRLRLVAASGTVVFEEAHELEAGRCKTNIEATLGAVATAGGTYLHLEISNHFGPADVDEATPNGIIPRRRCDPDATALYQQTLDLWVLLPVDGAPELVSRRLRASEDEVAWTLPADNGVLRYSHSYAPGLGLPGTSTVHSYRLSFTPAAGGPAKVLIEVEDEELGPAAYCGHGAW